MADALSDVLVVVATAASSLIAAWSAFSLRREIKPLQDREWLWRRPILTGREDLRLGALTCSTLATTCSLVDACLPARPAAHAAIVLALASVACTSAVLSLTERSSRRLVVYRS